MERTYIEVRKNAYTDDDFHKYAYTTHIRKLATSIMGSFIYVCFHKYAFMDVVILYAQIQKHAYMEVEFHTLPLLSWR